MKTILITGASGYVGKAFLSAHSRDYKFRVFGRTPVEGFEFFKGDIKSLEDLESAMKGVDAVLHLAAATTDLTTAPPGAVATGMRTTFAFAVVLIVVALALAAGSRARIRSSD